MQDDDVFGVSCERDRRDIPSSSSSSFLSFFTKLMVGEKCGGESELCLVAKDCKGLMMELLQRRVHLF